MICASAMAGFWTLPPKEPECRSTVGAGDVDLGVHRPRRPTVMAGRLPSKKPVSLMTARSAARRSRLATSQASKLRRAGLLLALEDDRRLTGSRARRLQPGARRPQVEMDLALVVGGATRVDRGRSRRAARTAAAPTGRADRPAGRRSGRRR